MEVQTRKKRSVVWEHFVQTEDRKFAECQLCDPPIKLPTDGGRTSRLLYHLKMCHPDRRRQQVAVVDIKTYPPPRNKNISKMGAHRRDHQKRRDLKSRARKPPRKLEQVSSSSMQGLQRNRSWSQVWDHFTKSGDGLSATCNKCGKELRIMSKRSTAATGGLLRHFRSYHDHDALPNLNDSSGPKTHKSLLWQHFDRSVDKLSARCKSCDLEILTPQGSTKVLMIHYRQFHKPSSIVTCRKSEVWQHFVQSEDRPRSAKCKLCDLEIKLGGSRNSITPLLRHFTRHHSNVSRVDEDESNKPSSSSPSSQGFKCDDYNDDSDDWEADNGLLRPSTSCLFCSKSCSEPTSPLNNEFFGAVGCSELEKHLKQDFILRNLLDIPSSWCEKALAKNNGESYPDSWFRICSGCIEVVNEGWQIYQKMLTLESNMNSVKEKIKDVVQKSERSSWKRRKTGAGIYKELRKRLLSVHPMDFVSVSIEPECSRDVKVEASDGEDESHISTDDFVTNDSAVEEEGEEEDFEAGKKITNDIVPGEEGSQSSPPKAQPPNVESENPGTSSALERKSSLSGKDKGDMKGHLGLKDNNPFPIKYPCKRCDFVGDDIWKLRNHFRSEHPDLPPEELENKTCSECGRKFDTRSTLVAHQRKMHPTMFGVEEEIIGCDECELVFSSKLHLHYHKRNTHLRVNNFMCDTCGKGFSSGPYLERHKKSHGEKHVCDICGLDYSTQQILDKHLKEEHQGPTSTSAKEGESQEEIYKCKHCDLTSPFRLVIRRHMPSHKKERGFQCDICQKLYSNERGLKLHQKIKHSGSTEQFKCPHCSKPFPALQYMKYHLKSCHVKRLVDESRIQYTTDAMAGVGDNFGQQQHPTLTGADGNFSSDTSRN